MWLQTICGIVFLVVSWFINALEQVCLEHYHKESIFLNKPLYDWLFTILPHIRMPWLADVCIAVMVVLAWVPLMIFHKRRALIFRRLVLIQGFIFYMRAITLMLTVLPASDRVSVPDSKPDENIFYEALRVITFNRKTCGDVMFSGHTTLLISSNMVFQEYASGIIGNATLLLSMRVIFRLFAFIGCLVIIGTHFHYTIDVLVGCIVTYTSFKMYHTLVRVNKSLLLLWYERGLTPETQPLIESDGS